LSILRIALKLHFVQNVEPDIPLLAGGKRGRFAKVSPCELCCRVVHFCAGLAVGYSMEIQ
ncbi:MAG: hypothetical protein V3T59_00840, partial [Desulfobacterales bacterium]